MARAWEKHGADGWETAVFEFYTNHAELVAQTMRMPLALAQMIHLHRRYRGSTHANRGVVFFAIVCIQASLGIATLLYSVPLSVALAHQALAMIVLGMTVGNLRAEFPARPA